MKLDVLTSHKSIIMNVNVVIIILTMLILMASKVTAAEEVSIVHVLNLEPWAYTDSKDEPQGILVAFFKLLETESGHYMKIEVVPYKRMLHQIKGDTTDIAILSLPKKSIGIPIAKILNIKFIAVYRQGLS